MSTSLTILITGSSSGFGYLTAKTLAEAGHTVFASMRGVAGKNAAQAAELRAWADQENRTLHLVDLDVTDDASVEAAVQTVLNTAGRLDVVVNNAGVGTFGVNEAFSLDQARILYEVNVFGVLRVMQATLPHLRRQQSGLIINVSSGLGRLIIPFVGLYTSTKWALEALTESSHYELAPLGIDVVLVQPGAYGTNFGPNLMRPAAQERFAAYGPVTEMAQQFAAGRQQTLSSPDAPNPQEVADVIARVIDTPPGERPLRSPVGQNMQGVVAINETAAQVQTGLLGALGMTAMLQLAPVAEEAG